MFDVVDHYILLTKLYEDGIRGADWILQRDMYTGGTTKVKRRGGLSKHQQVLQGVRQGGVLSTTHYKRFNNPLLLDMEEKCQDARIRGAKIPHTTSADDLALLRHESLDMQKIHD